MSRPPVATGLRAHLAGAAAEEQAARAYVARGYQLVEQRWRGAGGEIDLILRQGALWVFVEVKTGPSYAATVARITPRQMQRVQASAALYLDQQAGGALAEARIDVALVIGTQEVEILENAYGQG
ncbi:YraN family protein [Pseudophaeobacter profundi]|uniref:YraN family protein n=1 Tax=Pseudophaeobacter profundi TaxID=3034152 RepID=UPI002431F147|nr:YraN family protein [Pseudophaeobacter profundi]